MLTETVAGRTFDYSHNVGRGAQTGMGFNTPVALTIGSDGVVYVANRGSESISNVGWNRTGVGQRISRVTLGETWGEEEYLGEFSRYGSNDGSVDLACRGRNRQAGQRLRRRRMDESRLGVRQGWKLPAALLDAATRRTGRERQLRHRHLCRRRPVHHRRPQPSGSASSAPTGLSSAPSAPRALAKANSIRPGA